MPELPEVETIRRDLAKRVAGRSITGFRLLRPEILTGIPPIQDLRWRILGKLIIRVERRGKYLILRFMGGDALIIHLMMTGQLLLHPKGTEPVLHTTAIIELDSKWELHFVDVRRFGRIWVVDSPDAVVGKLGLEPLAATFTAEELGRRLAGRAAPIKPLLLDQGVVAGVGNIYADEALFQAGIRPERPAGSLSPSEVCRLRDAVKDVLEAAVEHRGTSFTNYRDSAGEPGENQHHLQVFRRTGQPCPRCGTPIQRIAFRGRGTHFCPACQR
ncbi:MAG: bifunctional DNA-formamidopyrimidine glycosylase/DNA-(apurinic or apyrimidinic site) lyase [Chloroflexi bacterium]|nr:bifunctional DNA-formamidopyrimidine glycosylase/DNA-(apurinic or apyrimidinic site) lyase [Chloroflexota bacterium]